MNKVCKIGKKVVSLQPKIKTNNKLMLFGRKVFKN